MKFICTGGTIDSAYDVDICTAVPMDQTFIPTYLKKYIKHDLENVSFEQICMKDSRLITEEDLDKVIDIITNSKEDKFVVTIGTYKLFTAAQYVKQNLSRKDCVVSFTGAMYPLFNFAHTDAGYNIGAAITNSTLNKNGVYVIIAGKICDPSQKFALHTEDH